MGDLILYLGITAAGYALGTRLRTRRESLGWTERVKTAALVVLILVMGMRMGSNAQVIENISTIGLTALFMTLVLMAGSVLANTVMRRLVGIDRYGRLVRANPPEESVLRVPEAARVAACAAETESASRVPETEGNAAHASETEGGAARMTETGPAVPGTSAAAAGAEDGTQVSDAKGAGPEHAAREETCAQGADGEEASGRDAACVPEVRETDVETGAETADGKRHGDRMTLYIVLTVLAGLAVGYLVVRPAFAQHMDAFETAAGLCIKVGLCGLLFFVGLDLGLDGTVISNFRRVGLRILAFPLATVIGTLCASLLCGLVLPISTREALAVGAGFSWYTMAPGIILEHGYVVASAISFLHNVMRELLSIILIPVVASHVGYVESTCLAGAAAMDICLPVVERATNADIAVYSFVAGVTLTILVPILVPLILA